MLNLEYPLHQALFEDVNVLYTARHDETVRRLAYEDSDASFAVFLHQELGEMPLYSTMGDAGLSLTVPSRTHSPSLKKMIGDIASYGREAGAKDDLPAADTELAIIQLLDTKIDGDAFQAARMQLLATIGLLAGRNKPRAEQVEAVLERSSRDLSPGDTAFRRAVAVLRKHELRPGEEEALANMLEALEARLHASVKVPRTVAALNRYYQGIFVRRVLERLLDPKTNRRDVMDDIDMTKEPEAIPNPVSIRSGIGQAAPVIRVPGLLLPKGGEGEPRNFGGAPAAPDTTSAAEAEKSPRPRSTYRTDWIGALAVGWRYGGKTVEVELPSGNPDQPYRGAELNDRHGKPFIVIADTDEAGKNAMYYVDRRSARSLLADAPIPLLRVFQDKNKTVARRHGARRIYHTDDADFYSLPMRIINKLEKRNSWAPRPRRRRRA